MPKTTSYIKNEVLSFTEISSSNISNFLDGRITLFTQVIRLSRRNKKKNVTGETFKLMEKRLFFYIMNPAMIASWLFGVLLIYIIGTENLFNLWLQLKLIMVLLLTAYHFFLFHCLKNFSQDNSRYSSKFYRIANEVPTILLVGLIFTVVFKPL